MSNQVEDNSKFLWPSQKIYFFENLLLNDYSMQDCVPDWDHYIINQSNNYVTYLIYVLKHFLKKITLWYSSSRPNEVIKERKYDIAFFHTFKRVHLANLLLVTLTQNQTYARLSLYCAVRIHNIPVL